MKDRHALTRRRRDYAQVQAHRLIIFRTAKRSGVRGYYARRPVPFPLFRAQREAILRPDSLGCPARGSPAGGGSGVQRCPLPSRLAAAPSTLDETSVASSCALPSCSSTADASSSPAPASSPPSPPPGVPPPPSPDDERRRLLPPPPPPPPPPCVWWWWWPLVQALPTG